METPWPYLATEVFSTRQAIAAFLLRGLSPIVEVGGPPNRVRGYLPAGVDVIDVDEFQRWKGWPNGDYGVALLGLTLEGLGEPDWARLLKLVDGAKRCIIECPVDFSYSVAQRDRILATTTLKQSFEIQLRFVGAAMPEEGNRPYLLRSITLLERE